VLAAAVPLVSHVLQPTLRGSEEAVAWAAADPDAAQLTKVLDVGALPFLFGAGVVYVLLARRGATRLAYAGGVLLGCGLVGLAAVEGYETLAVTLAGDPRIDRSGLVAAADQTEGPAAMLMLGLLLVGSVPGTLLLATELWRSGAIPRGIALLVPVPLLLDVVVNEGLGIGPHWIPHAVSLVVAGLLAGTVLRVGSAASASGHPRSPVGRA